MLQKQRESMYVVGCDLSPETGEGFLAISLIELVQTRFSVIVYTDKLVQILRSHPLLRDRFLPLYLFTVCVVLRLGSHRVVLLNYVPIWNFLNAILARCGVQLAPITGSVLIVSARASLRERFIRLYFQRALITLSAWLLPRRSFVWCATPSVFLQLQNAGLKNLAFGFPYLHKIKPLPPMPKTFDLFIYSNAHPTKNHEAVRQFLASPLTRRFNICYVGPATETHSNVLSFSLIPEEEFNQLLARSRLYLTFSFEDAGITGFKALAYGMPVLCPNSSGLAYSVQYEGPYCFADPYDLEDICSKVSTLLSCKLLKEKSKLTKKFDQIKEQNNDASIKWISSL
jgi:glycosyltransferase involved in cell wall biosynthesis